MKIFARRFRDTDRTDDFSEAEVDQGHVAWTTNWEYTATGTNDHEAIGQLMVYLSCFEDFPIVIDDIVLEDLEDNE